MALAWTASRAERVLAEPVEDTGELILKASHDPREDHGGIVGLDEREAPGVSLVGKSCLALLKSGLRAPHRVAMSARGLLSSGLGVQSALRVVRGLAVLAALFVSRAHPFHSGLRLASA